jgi:hypothetical protein
VGEPSAAPTIAGELGSLPLDARRRLACDATVDLVSGCGELWSPATAAESSRAVAAVPRSASPITSGTGLTAGGLTDLENLVLLCTSTTTTITTGGGTSPTTTAAG